MQKTFFVIVFVSTLICISCKTVDDKPKAIDNENVTIKNQENHDVTSKNTTSLVIIISRIKRSVLEHVGIKKIILIIIKSIIMLSPFGYLFSLIRLLSFLYSLIVALYSFVNNFMSKPIPYVIGLISSGLSNMSRSTQGALAMIGHRILENLWIVMKNYGFPNLDMILMKLKDWPNVPTLFRIWIGEVHSIYSLLQLLGYLRPE